MNTTSQKSPPLNLPVKSPSWIAERDAIRRFGDRKTRAILAIYHARRSSRKPVFFIHPDIAKVNGLSSKQLNWALDKLEGSMIETVQARNGRYRTFCLLPPFENANVETPASPPERPLDPTVSGEERVIVDTAEVLSRLKQSEMRPTDWSLH